MAEIQISELSIGDWVSADGVAKRVHSIDYQNGEYFVNFSDPDANSEDYIHAPLVEPIPLTPEILEKNGAVKWQGGLVLIGDEISCRYEDGNLTIEQGYRDSEGVLVERLLVNIECKAVHQLQHALRLAGVGKEIEV